MAVAAGFNPAKKESYLTLVCQCEIHLLVWAAPSQQIPHSESLQQPRFSSYLVSRHTKDGNSLTNRPVFSPQDTSLWGRVETCRAGRMLRYYLCCLDWTPLSQAVKQACTFDIKSMNCKSTNGRWFSKGIFIASRKLQANCLKRLWKFSKTAQHRPRSLLLV